MRRGYVYYVYDIRTTMYDFCASFAVREHAEEWGKAKFGEYAFVSDKRLNKNDWIWDGRPFREEGAA